MKSHPGSRSGRTNNPNHLLRRHRVHHPGQHEAGHHDKQCPEDSLHLLVLPKD